MLPLLITFATGFLQGPPWAQFSRAQYLRGVNEIVEIGSGKSTGAKDFRYTMKLTRTRSGQKPAVLWADSATCLTMASIIAKMSVITMPQPAPYGVPGSSPTIVVDGSGYELSSPSTDVMGSLTIRSNEGSPLSQWVDDAFKRLEGCWSALPLQ